MITKEIKYDDAVVNGFLALFLNLIVLPLLVVVSFMLFKGSIIMFFLLLLFLALAVLMIPGYFRRNRTKPVSWYSSGNIKVRLLKRDFSGLILL